jgi:hypothetical protein
MGLQAQQGIAVQGAGVSASFSTPDPVKRLEAAMLSLRVKEFVANGGKIQVLPPGACKESPVKTFQEHNALAWRKRNAD